MFMILVVFHNNIVSDDKAGNSIPLEVVDSTMDVKPIYK